MVTRLRPRSVWVASISFWSTHAMNRTNPVFSESQRKGWLPTPTSVSIGLTIGLPMVDQCYGTKAQTEVGLGSKYIFLFDSCSESNESGILRIAEKRLVTYTDLGLHRTYQRTSHGGPVLWYQGSDRGRSG